ncbi:helix-turn-helix transcriptional regulator [Maribacter thermophilus]|uniref:helix-turn-helix transcriptional regulator n=1 Tax=Maribacter thermophilus TaxID=1197874 RepID=UPI0006413240|nr:helix-turn-helix transcriptional regulator [Maribacter thermophilus]
MTGEELRQLRLKNGYTQKQLAEIIGVTRKTINAHENSNNIPKSKAKLYRLKLGNLDKINEESRIKLPTKPFNKNKIDEMDVRDLAGYIADNKEELMKDVIFKTVIESLYSKDEILKILKEINQNLKPQ